MRFFVRVLWDIEKGNALARKGALAATVKSILEQTKPEAAYFPAADGHRSTYMIVNLSDPSELPAIAEPWFLALNATVEFEPVMRPEDLAKAEPAIARAAKNF